MSPLPQPSSQPPGPGTLLDVPGGPSAILRLGGALWCVLDRRGAFLRRGSGWEALGWPDSIYERLRYWELLHPDDALVAAGPGRPEPANRSPVHFAARVLSAYGAYRHVDWCAERLPHDRWLLTGHDVTEHAVAAERLRELRARYESLCDASFAAVLVYRRGRVVEANRAACELFGCSRPELIGRHAGGMLADGEFERWLTSGRAAALHRPRARALRRDGTLVEVEIHARAVSVNGARERVVALRRP
ncbi:MAG TPA: PAS domain S-box protein [Sandaracinaceae bacterium]